LKKESGKQSALTINDNILMDNRHGIYIDDGAQVTGLDLGCNLFELEFDFTQDDRYGIYVHEKGLLLDYTIGGLGAFPLFPLPAGNGWPAKDKSDPDIDNWEAPDNWFSIFDNSLSEDEVTLNWTYYRYYNEFIGEGLDPSAFPIDAVFASANIIRAGPNVTANNNTTTCTNRPEILFPARIGILLLDEKTFSDLSLYPNPADMVLYIEGTDEVTEDNVEIINILGTKETFGIKLLDSKQILSLSNLKSGYYFLRITLKNQVYKIPFLVNH
jgi:Secretion system C-terminal sorting domain